jgi:uncharacterized protein YnzC (UPF0291/DUF896 family)
MKEEKIKRINELWKKQKKEGLTEQEKKEQKKLREEYIKDVKQKVKTQIENQKNISSSGNK